MMYIGYSYDMYITGGATCTYMYIHTYIKCGLFL